MGVIWGNLLWCAVGVAVAALARAKKKGQKTQFLSRIHALRSCGPLGYGETHSKYDEWLESDRPMKKLGEKGGDLSEGYLKVYRTYINQLSKV